MPTYEYLCDDCGKMDIKQSIHEEILKKCPGCESDLFKKIILAPPIKFVGSGFYKTDSRG
jgi:putative FmdB family regulatory protein